MAVEGYMITTMMTPPTVVIKNLVVESTGATLEWDLTPVQIAQSNNIFLNSVLSVPHVTSYAEVKSYTYRLKFSTSLAIPRSEWSIVKVDTITVNSNATKPITSVLDDMPVLPTSGFYFLEITE
jgi:hypothetical protein